MSDGAEILVYLAVGWGWVGNSKKHVQLFAFDLTMPLSVRIKSCPGQSGADSDPKISVVSLPRAEHRKTLFLGLKAMQNTLTFNLEITMEKLVASIQDFPVIVQGAMGSALFALVLYVGQKIAAYCFDSVRANSKKTRIRQIKEQYIRFCALSAEDSSERTYFVSVLWLRASRHLVKALIWLVLGLASESAFGAFGPFGAVGFTGAIFYLFLALNIVKPIEFDGDIQQKTEELKAEMDKLCYDYAVFDERIKSRKSDL